MLAQTSPVPISFQTEEKKERDKQNTWTLMKLMITIRINQHFGQVHPLLTIFNINIA